MDDAAALVLGDLAVGEAERDPVLPLEQLQRASEGDHGAAPLLDRLRPQRPSRYGRWQASLTRSRVVAYGFGRSDYAEGQSV